MKISRNWLLEFVDFGDASPEEYVDLITTRVAEIEDVYEVGSPLNHAQIVRVKKFSPHPEKTNLNVVEVETKDGTVSIVCGADNLYEGMLAACILPGGYARKPGLSAEEETLIKIENRELLGVKSVGMLCSESELGIGPSHDGILDCSHGFLDYKFKVGDSLSEVLGGPDLIIDIDNKSLTHRPDLWSHFGFARELAAIFSKPLIKNYDDQIDSNYCYTGELSKIQAGKFKSVIEDKDFCRRFSVTEISNLKNGTSPIWLKQRLFVIGAGVRNVLVDASNYVLHEIGQPNHAYDLSRLNGTSLFARKAKAGENFVALDDVERRLSEEDFVIADAKCAVALAGVIGGKGFSVESSTTEILLENANFDPVAVRQMCKRHQVRTDSSNRFEKSLSSVQVPLGAMAFVNVLRRSGLSPEVTSYYDAPHEVQEKVFVAYSPSDIQDRLQGVPESNEEINGIISKLNFKIEKSQVQVPYYRATKDISIPADLVEEVGRSIGYDRVPEKAPLIATTGCERSLLLEVELNLARSLSSQGFSEVYNYTFSSLDKLKELGYSLNDSLELQNSVDQSLSSIRTTLVPGMLEVAAKNQRYLEEFSIFEIGRTYHKVSDKLDSDGRGIEPLERRMLSLLNCSSESKTTIKSSLSEEGSTFYGIKTLIERLGAQLNCKDIKFIPIDVNLNDVSAAGDFNGLKYWMHPYRAATVKSGNLSCGVLAEVRPSLVKRKGFRQVVAEIDIQALLATAGNKTTFEKLPKFPSSLFEVSAVVPKKAYYSEIRAKIFSALSETQSLREIRPISVYQGQGLPEDSKSLSLQFVFSKTDNTIGSDELNVLREDVMKAVSKAGYSLRS